VLSVNELKYYTSLKVKKYRQDEKKFFVEGKKQIEEGLKSSWTCEIIFHTPDFGENDKSFLRQVKSKVTRLEEIKTIDFNKLSDTKSPQGIISVFHQKVFPPNELIPGKPLVLLENISDPGNLGTILRSCDWFGIKNIILNKDCADIYNPKVIRSTMGSIFHLNLFQPEDYLSVIRKLKSKGYKILTADTEGTSYKKYKYQAKTILVLASESHGPTKEILKISDEKITIDRIGNAESLNVAGAAAVLLSELSFSLFPS
jgi:RNA methyltransferase, TrmH family